MGQCVDEKKKTKSINSKVPKRINTLNSTRECSHENTWLEMNLRDYNHRYLVYQLLSCRLESRTKNRNFLYANLTGVALKRVKDINKFQ